MFDYIYLAWQYLLRNKGTTTILVASITLIFFLPSALVVVVDDATVHLRSRSASTPLVVGSRGSQLELVLGTLYFDDPQPEVMRMSQLDRLNAIDCGTTIPLHTAIRTGDTAIVGTTTEYFKLRKTTLSSGRSLKILGECIVGAKAARRLGLKVGDKTPVSMQKAFALGDAPLRLNVVGILATTETPDDEVIFVDLKTVWIIEGLGHGHATGAKHGTSAAAEFTDITSENESEFHFHGDPSRFPITAVIVQPRDTKARTMLFGEYLSPEDPAQVVRPGEVMDDMLSRILTVQSYIISIVAIVSCVTLAVIGLVIMLSIRLRKRELDTMTKMGCSRFAITAILGCQIVIVLGVSVIAASGLTMLASSFGHAFVRTFVL